MRTFRSTVTRTLRWAAAFASLLALAGCASAGPDSESAQEAAETSIPMDDNPEVAAAVQNAVADMKAADPSVNLTVSEDGTVLTGDEDSMAALATSLTSEYEGNEAMGKKTYCLYNGGACGVFTEDGFLVSCHQGRYWGSFFAWMDAFARQATCGSGSVDVKSGGCPSDGSCYRR